MPGTLLKKGYFMIISCEFCEIFQNAYFIEHLWNTALKMKLKIGTRG